MNKRERIFQESHRNETGHEIIWQTGRLSFFYENRRTKYTPDFYCQECKIFYEVVGSRQAFHQNRLKIEGFRSAYPFIPLNYVNPDGSNYNTKKFHRSTYRGYWEGRVAPVDLAARQKVIFRLQSAIANGLCDIASISQWTGLCYDTIRYTIIGDQFPHPKTARLIHQYLDNIEQQQKTA